MTTSAARTPPPVWTAAPALSESEFELLRRLIYRESGIRLGDGKQALVVARLARRLRELGLSSYRRYYREIVEGDGDELVRLLDLITTKETRFFREPAQFTLLDQMLCPTWQAEATMGRRPRRLRVWSAACATGEEPWSLAMLLHERLVRHGWEVEILATDIAPRALERAQAGVFPAERAEHIPLALSARGLRRGPGDSVTIASHLRPMVRFARLNLHADSWPDAEPWDAVLCRNALIYFDAASRERALRRLLGRLAPGGYLFLGHAESLSAGTWPVRPVMPSVYRLADAPPRVHGAL